MMLRRRPDRIGAITEFMRKNRRSVLSRTGSASPPMPGRSAGRDDRPTMTRRRIEIE